MAKDAIGDSFPRTELHLRTQEERAALGGAPAIGVNFRVPRQEQTNWCWAAVSSAVARYFRNNNWTQCAVATAEMGGQCCRNGGSVRCNQPHFLERALARVGRFRNMTPPVPRPTVESELRSRRPLAIRVGWRLGGGHFLAISGATPYGPVDAIFELTDPIYGVSTIVGSALAGGGYQQGGGRWTHSYFVG